MTELLLSLSRRVLPHWTWRQWTSLVLAALLIACLPWALSEADWLELPEPLWLAAIWGSAAGWLVSKIARRSRVAAPILLIITGVLFLGAHHSRAWPPFGAGAGEAGKLIAWAGAEAVGTLRNTFASPPESEDVPLPHVAIPRPPLPEWEAAGSRISLYTLNLQQDWPPSPKPRQWQHGQILLSSLMSMIVWLIAGSIVWMMLSGASAWLGLIPLGGLIAASIYLSDSGWVFALLALVFTLMLDSEFALRALERRWPPGRTYSFLAQEWWFTTGIFAATALFVMGITLGLTDPDLYKWVNETLNPQPEGGSQAGSGSQLPREPRQAPPGIWPTDQLLQGSIDLSQQPAMTVRTPGAPPARFYWKATSYDEYTGRGWRQSAGTRSPSQDREMWPDSTEPPPGFALLRQEYRLEFETRQILAAGQPVRLSYAGEGVWAGQSGSDLIAIQSPTTIHGYEVLSWVPAFTVEELRAADIDPLPVWVEFRYLQLPSTLPDRVRALAGNITSGAPTPYDRALAIQTYLREFPYTLELPEVTPNADAVDTFLFDLQRGYCDYYASAMVVMARSVGIPARLSVGYRMGTYDPASQAYFVTMADAHSWPELYFEGIGWIPFEPTAAYPDLERGLPLDWGTFEPESIPQEPEWVTSQGSETIAVRSLWPLFVIIGAAVFIALVLAVREVIHEQQRRRLPPDQLIASVYRSTVESARRLGVTVDSSQTPHEFFAAMSAALSVHADVLPEWSGAWQERAQQIDDAVRALIEIYADGRYSPRHAARAEAERALELWPPIRRGLRQFRLAVGLSGRKKAQTLPVQTGADYA
jgi:transglutaminase-like putative cysteine protease